MNTITQMKKLRRNKIKQFLPIYSAVNSEARILIQNNKCMLFPFTLNFHNNNSRLKIGNCHYTPSSLVNVLTFKNAKPVQALSIIRYRTEILAFPTTLDITT